MKIPAVSAILCSSLLGGCTFIGGAIGAATESPTSRSPAVTHDLRRGRWLKVSLFDGSTRRGRFQGLSILQDAVYAQAWKERAARVGLDLELGPARVDADGPRGELVGVELRGLSVRVLPQEAATLVPWGSFTAVTDHRGRQVTSAAIADQVGNGRLPTRTRLDILVDRERQSLPLGDVVRITTDDHSSLGRGLAIGLTLDVLALVAVRRAMDDLEIWGSY